MHPVFIRLGNFPIHSYGVCVALGFLVGLTLATRRAKSAGLPAETIANLGIWLIIAGMLGGKLFHLLFFWNDFVAGWRANGLAALREGFVFYGGFIGASGATIIYCWRQRLPLWKVADVFAPSVALGHAFGRLGCFFNGCCAGKACALPWAVRFPGHVDAVHPTQLYEVAGNLVIFAALSAIYRHRKFDGQVWWLYVLSYGVLRFVVEFFRGDYPYYLPGGFTIGQAIAAVLLLVALVGCFRMETRPKSR